MRNAPRIPIALLLASAALGGCSAQADPPGSAPGERSLALWSELLEDDSIRGELTFLEERSADLYLAVHAERVGDPELARLIREANDRDVGVRAWLLLPREDGYWANEHNVAEMRELAEAFDDFRKEEALEVDWVIFDMETSFERTQRLNEATTDEIYALRVQEGMEREAFDAAKRAYRELLNDLHDRGLKVMAVTYPQLLDDSGDCDPDLQDAYDVPLDDLPWDEVSFMIYNSAFSASLGEYFEADLVQAYAELAVEQWGERASVALGIVGEAGVLPVPYPYRAPSYLEDDRAAARAAGIERVSVFALDGVREQEDPPAWLPPQVEPRAAEIGDNVRGMREAFAELDAFLGENTCD